MPDIRVVEHGANLPSHPRVIAAQVLAQYANVVPHVTESAAAAGVWSAAAKIAVLFGDGDHAKEAVLADLAAWEPRLAARAAIVLDDMTWPGVAEAAKEFFRGRKEWKRLTKWRFQNGNIAAWGRGVKTGLLR